MYALVSPQCRAEVVVAGVVVAKALFWTDIVTVFGLFVTDFAQSDYDHFSYDHLCVVPISLRGPRLPGSRAVARGGGPRTRRPTGMVC